MLVHKVGYAPLTPFIFSQKFSKFFIMRSQSITHSQGRVQQSGLPSNKTLFFSPKLFKIPTQIPDISKHGMTSRLALLLYNIKLTLTKRFINSTTVAGNMLHSLCSWFGSNASQFALSASMKCLDWEMLELLMVQKFVWWWISWARSAPAKKSSNLQERNHKELQ